MIYVIRLLSEAATSKERAGASQTAQEMGQPTVDRLQQEATQLRAAISILLKASHENDQSSGH